MTKTIWAAAAVLALAGSLAACAPHGCATSTDPLTCQNTEGVSNYNRQRQLYGAAPRPAYPSSYYYNQNYRNPNYY